MDLERVITSYHMSDETKELVQSTQLLLIAGIMGGGKNTVINELMKTGGYRMIVSHTTRSQRENHGVMEQDGVDYHFVSIETMQRLIEQQAFVEVKYVHGNVYGTSAAELRLAHENNRSAVTDIDIQGVVEYLDIKPDTHAIFLLPPSVETWFHRLGRRYGDLDQHKDEVHKRLQTASDEITFIMNDKRFILVINDDLDTTVARIRKIISGERDQTSDYAYSVAEHLLEYIKAHTV